jgi:hypothetical protein
MPDKELDPPQVSVLIDFLQVVLGHLALQMKLSPSLICTVADLRAIVKAALHDSAPGASLLDVGWRAKHIRPLLDAVLNGEYALRVGRPDTSVPLEFTMPCPHQAVKPAGDER